MTNEQTKMNITEAREILARLIGQPIRGADGQQEHYLPRGCRGPAGQLIVDQLEGNGLVRCCVEGWETSVARPVESVILPPGLSHAKVGRAIAALDEADEDYTT